MFVLRSLLRFIVTFLLLLLLYQTVKAQEPAKLISTLNIAGSSNTLTIDSRKYYYQQSIGQSGIIGLSGGKNQLIRQGFIQPVPGRESPMLAGELRVEIYPNPFSDYITISFPEKISEILYVTIYDLNGRIVYLKKFEAAGELNIDLKGLASSIYIIRINTNTRHFSSKVVRISY